MGGFKIYQDSYADFTVVSNRFIDEYMEDANDAQLKVYLYLIRMLGADLPTGISDIADRFNYTEKDVVRALRYWEKKHLISIEHDASKNIVGVCMLSTSATVVAHPSLVAVSGDNIIVPGENVVNAGSVVAPLPVAEVCNSVIDEDAFTKPVFSKEDLKAFKTHEASSQLIFIAEQYLHKTLSVAELGTLLYISATLHFSDDLIDYLLQYCVGRDKTDYRYIEAVALDWAQSGIKTPKQAASHARKYDKIVYEIMNALGKSSSPSSIEISYINKWTRDYAYDMTVIEVACERTVLNTDKKRFSYADSILTRWHEMGIRHKADIEAIDPQRRRAERKTVNGNNSNSNGGDGNKFNQFTQNTYDFDALEKALISN